MIMLDPLRVLSHVHVRVHNRKNVMMIVPRNVHRRWRLSTLSSPEIDLNPGEAVTVEILSALPTLTRAIAVSGTVMNHRLDDLERTQILIIQ